MERPRAAGPNVRDRGFELLRVAARVLVLVRPRQLAAHPARHRDADSIAQQRPAHGRLEAVLCPLAAAADAVGRAHNRRRLGPPLRQALQPLRVLDAQQAELSVTQQDSHAAVALREGGCKPHRRRALGIGEVNAHARAARVCPELLRCLCAVTGRPVGAQCDGAAGTRARKHLSAAAEALEVAGQQHIPGVAMQRCDQEHPPPALRDAKCRAVDDPVRPAVAQPLEFSDDVRDGRLTGRAAVTVVPVKQTGHILQQQPLHPRAPWVGYQAEHVAHQPSCCPVNACAAARPADVYAGEAGGQDLRLCGQALQLRNVADHVNAGKASLQHRACGLVALGLQYDVVPCLLQAQVQGAAAAEQGRHFHASPRRMHRFAHGWWRRRAAICTRAPRWRGRRDPRRVAKPVAPCAAGAGCCSPVMADEVEKVKRAAAATISKLTEEKAVLTEQLRVMQRAVSESQRVAAEASEEVERLRSELELEKKATSGVEERAGDKLAALERAVKAEREKAASAELAANATLAAAAQAAAAREKALQEEAAAVRSELATEKERVAELQRSVEHLTRAGDEARELWARLKQALLVRACLVGALFCSWGLSGQLPVPVSLAPPLPPRRRRRCVTRRWAQSRP